MHAQGKTARDQFGEKGRRNFAGGSASNLSDDSTVDRCSRNIACTIGSLFKQSSSVSEKTRTAGRWQDDEQRTLQPARHFTPADVPQWLARLADAEADEEPVRFSNWLRERPKNLTECLPHRDWSKRTASADGLVVRRLSARVKACLEPAAAGSCIGGESQLPSLCISAQKAESPLNFLSIFPLVRSERI